MVMKRKGFGYFVYVLSPSCFCRECCIMIVRQVFRKALVIGNGTMGATLYGGVKREKISFNDITLWTGEPESENSSPDAFNTIPEIRRHYWIMRIIKGPIRLNTRYKDITAKGISHLEH